MHHGAAIITYSRLGRHFLGLNVGKVSSTMEHLGYSNYIHNILNLSMKISPRTSSNKFLGFLGFGMIYIYIYTMFDIYIYTIFYTHIYIYTIIICMYWYLSIVIHLSSAHRFVTTISNRSTTELSHGK